MMKALPGGSEKKERKKIREDIKERLFYDWKDLSAQTVSECIISYPKVLNLPCAGSAKLFFSHFLAFLRTLLIEFRLVKS